MKSVLWRVAKRLSYIEDARCLKVRARKLCETHFEQIPTVAWYRLCRKQE